MVRSVEAKVFAHSVVKEERAGTLGSDLGLEESNQRLAVQINELGHA
jgi:hypothetical protein